MGKQIANGEHHEVRKAITELLASKGAKEALNLFVLLKHGKTYTLAISGKLAREIGLGLKTVIIRADNFRDAYYKFDSLFDEEHREIEKQISGLLTAKIGAIQDAVPFSFSAKVRGCTCIKLACACKKVREYTLVIGSNITSRIGLGLKELVIQEENPWMVYSSLALLIINSSTGTGT